MFVVDDVVCICCVSNFLVAVVVLPSVLWPHIYKNTICQGKGVEIRKISKEYKDTYKILKQKP